MMFFGGLFMLVLAALVVAGVLAILVGLPAIGVALWQPVTHALARRTCPSCGRALQDDWRNCPSCGPPAA